MFTSKIGHSDDVALRVRAACYPLPPSAWLLSLSEGLNEVSPHYSCHDCHGIAANSSLVAGSAWPVDSAWPFLPAPLSPEEGVDASLPVRTGLT